MNYSSRTRDRFRIAITSVTGLTTIGALSVTGWLAGLVAQDFAAEQAVKAQDEAAQRTAWEAATRKAARQQKAYNAAVAKQNRQAHPQVILVERPQRTRVSLQYVQAGGGSSVGSGGTVLAQGSSGGSTAPSSTPPQSSGSQPAPPPPPPPPPAPTSGS